MTVVRPEPMVFDVETYDAMISAGILTKYDRVELINGTIIQMTPIGNPHASTVDELTMLLAPRLIGRAIVRVQGPVKLGDLSKPQPDLTVLRLRPGGYRRVAPSPADTQLMIEVADTSLNFDRTVKGPLYAATGVPELWIVDLVGRGVEVYRDPRPDGYAEKRTLTSPADRLSPLAFPDLVISLEDVLGTEP